MAYAEDWGELMFNLHCLSKASARRQFRHHIRYSFGGLCAYCRQRRATTVDHIRPRCQSGSSLRSNLLPACKECNQSKGSEPCWKTWFKRQSFYNETAFELIEEWIKNGHRDIEDDEKDHLILEEWVKQETTVEDTEDGIDDRTEVCTNSC